MAPSLTNSEDPTATARRYERPPPLRPPSTVTVVASPTGLL